MNIFGRGGQPDAAELREAEFQLKMSRKGDEPRRETPKMRELKMPPDESTSETPEEADEPSAE